MRNPNPARINKIPKIEINKITLILMRLRTVIKRKLPQRYKYISKLVNKMRVNMTFILALAIFANFANSLESSSDFSMLKIFTSITHTGQSYFYKNMKRNFSR